MLKIYNGMAEARDKIFPVANATKYRPVFGRDLEGPYREVIACPFTDQAMYVPLLPL